MVNFLFNFVAVREDCPSSLLVMSLPLFFSLVIRNHSHITSDFCPFQTLFNRNCVKNKYRQCISKPLPEYWGNMWSLPSSVVTKKVETGRMYHTIVDITSMTRLLHDFHLLVIYFGRKELLIADLIITTMIFWLIANLRTDR